MSGKHRSLASFFDEPGDSQYSWHEQTEPLRAPPAPTGGLGGEHAEGLGRWMYVPGKSEMLWVPEGYQYTDLPHTAQPHYKDNKSWDENDWGYDEYMRKQQQTKQEKSSEPKPPKPKMTEEERKVWKLNLASERQKRRKDRSDKVKKLHDHAYGVLMTIESVPIRRTIRGVTVVLEQAKTANRAKIVELKGEEINGATRKNRLHEETSNFIVDNHWTGSDGVLVEIDTYCRDNGLFNTLGLKLPEANKDGTRYLSVEILFLSKAKEVMMSAVLHVLAKKAKTGSATVQECDYVNTTYQANDILSKMRGKDRYMRKPNPKLADSHAIKMCKTMIMDLEKKRWQALHPKAKEVPKHFKWAPPGGDHNKKKEESKGTSHKHLTPEDLKELVELYKVYQETKSHPHHTHKHHQKEGTGPPRTAPPPARRGRGRPAPPPARPAAYMHGYYY